MLFGQQSADGGGACLWAAVAERSAAPGRLAGERADASRAARSRGKRQTEYGYDTIRAPLPAVVAVADSINTPRYPSLKGIMGAKKKPQETRSAADVGGGGALPARRCSRSHRRRRAATSRKIEDDGSGAEQIVAFLAEKRFV